MIREFDSSRVTGDQTGAAVAKNIQQKSITYITPLLRLGSPPPYPLHRAAAHPFP